MPREPSVSWHGSLPVFQTPLGRHPATRHWTVAVAVSFRSVIARTTYSGRGRAPWELELLLIAEAMNMWRNQRYCPHCKREEPKQ